MKVFLGGTCNGSTWRKELMAKLRPSITCYNPVVDVWTPEEQEEEVRQRLESDICLYVITPKMEGVFSIAELVQDSNERPKQTIFCFMEQDEDKIFTRHQIDSLKQVGQLVSKNGAFWLADLLYVSLHLNMLAKKEEETWSPEEAFRYDQLEVSDTVRSIIRNTLEKQGRNESNENG